MQIEPSRLNHAFYKTNSTLPKDRSSEKTASSGQQDAAPIDYNASNSIKAQALFKRRNINNDSINKQEKGAAFFNSELNRTEQDYLSSLDCTKEKKEIIKKMLLLKNPNGENFFEKDVINEILKIPDTQAENILKRNLINENIVDKYEPFIFSKMNDKKWEEISPFANKLYEYASNEKNPNSANMKYSIQEYAIFDYYNLDNLLDVYSMSKIRNIIELPSRVKFIKEMLDRGDVKTSNIEMLMALVEDGKLSPRALFFNSTESNIDKNVEEDLDKLYESYIEKKSEKEIFVPAFKTEKEALNNLKTGDVCALDNKKNIYIKNKDNVLEEMFISPDAYLELFPPVSRNIHTQGDTGDCFLISTLASLYSNPGSRSKILGFFMEDKKGKINMNISGYKKQRGKIVKNNKNAFELKDICPKLKENLPLSDGSPYMRALELLFEKNADNNAEDGFLKTYELYKAFYNNVCNDNPIMLNEYNIITNREIEEFLKFSKEHFENPNDPKKRIISPNDKFYIQNFTYENNLNFVKEKLEKCDEKYKEYLKSIFEGLSIVCAANKLDKISYSKYLPYELYTFLNNEDCKDINPSFYYIHAGNSDTVLEKLGYHDVDEINTKINSQKAKELLISEKAPEYIFTATKVFEEEKSAHEYSISPINSGKEKMFAVRDPHNSAEEKIITLDEFLKEFKYLTAAKI